jgi:hypothetical protein
MRRIINYIKLTKVGKLLASFVWLFIWLGLESVTKVEWFFYVAMVGTVYPILLTLVMIAYAWVINPIRDLKESRNNHKK